MADGLARSEYLIELVPISPVNSLESIEYPAVEGSTIIPFLIPSLSPKPPSSIVRLIVSAIPSLS